MAAQIDQREHKEAPWFVEWRFSYDEGLVKALGQIPGCKWVKQGRYWLVPIEIAQWLRRKRDAE